MTQRQRRVPRSSRASQGPGYDRSRQAPGNRRQSPAPKRRSSAGNRTSAGRGAPDRRRAPGKRRRVWPRLLAVPIIALVIWFALTHYVFLIRNVEVVGADDMAASDVVRLSGIPLGGRLNAVDADNLRNKVESTGQLAFVSVEKKYPTTVVLTVRRRSRDAITLQAGKLLVLDSDGYVVSVGDAAPEDGMPYVMGLKASSYRLGRQLDAPESRLNAMKSVLEALKAHSATGYVSEVNLEVLSDIELISRKGIVVSLGDSDNMNNKVIWMVGALQDLESRGETLGRLDVSSGSKADFLSGASPTPAPTATPVPEITPEAEAVIGDDAI